MEQNYSESQHDADAGRESRGVLMWLLLATIPAAAIGGYFVDANAAGWVIAGGSAALSCVVALIFGGSDTPAPRLDSGCVTRPARAAGVGHGASRVESTGASRKWFGARATPNASDSEESFDGATDVLARAMEVRSTERTALLNSLTDSVILVDAHGETRFANKAAGAMLGEHATDAGTRYAIEALPSQALRAVQAVIEAGGSERRRIETELKDSETTPVVVLVTLVVGCSEGLAAIIVRDVRSEREADRMKSEFVAKASHELRTPLASLRAYAELLADGEVADDNQRREFAGVILSETGRLSALVDRMLDIGRIESGMSRASLESVDFSELGLRCVEEQQGEAQRRMITMKVTRTERSAIASADRALMKQVILNLLSNAVKYTPDGGEVSVEIDTDNLARTVVVSVRDNGLGIPEHALPRLFGKFYRVENHEKFAKGTGLGLNLCRNIVEAMHGGQIGVDSKVGVGSRFWFAIPMDQAARKAA
jgi:two-component system, OmpR family, phosphate regulon sensor histidine kinase PhoR